MLKKLVGYLIITFLLFNLLSLNVISIGDDDLYEYNEEVVEVMVANTSFDSFESKAFILIDAATGQVLTEKSSHDKLPIASVTKVMSMLLIMEAIDSGKIKLDDMVTASDYAAGMGGSQAYVEPGEQYSVRDALKAVALHSSNDVTVSLAEMINGSEEGFVVMMNEKAEELGMKNTHFLDCTGLTDEGHYSTAYDVALMSKELVTKHPGILEYTSIWMDSFRGGEFELSNTNKLIRFYNGADGLKTGFTQAAKHCLSATAKRNNMRLVSVVLGGADSNSRFAQSRKLLDYGFANYESTNVNKEGGEVREVEIRKGLENMAKAVYADDLNLLLSRGQRDKVKREIRVMKSIAAPVKKGQRIGEVIYKVDDNEIARMDLICDREIQKASFAKMFKRLFVNWYNVGRSTD
ncbi:D-alanyl-D-alanine carboxypeptidase family protein [Herbivorax sp. ANBcel31]|uniref:D-alanyl-D-alanine carboxypeptidase family protein n=1 Tax=Herbivorax sp. ANBcel31 TaxID=3069754 RepID=UPI0027B0923F|nr:D-alanyl-D-alanine carboxypeptidase family protein [Herbivorax sp. ANBcel31]MDQ2086200.1 D-alanyl-D-alanine carboxypeptidase family protein [Herbivorax sp. ANBcel31]